MAHHTAPPPVAPAKLLKFNDLWTNYPNNEPV